MKIQVAVAKLLAGVPRGDAWACAAGEAYGPQYIGSEDSVDKVLYCVTTTPEVERLFAEGRYDLLVAHHPFRPRARIPHVVLHTSLDCCQGGLNDLWRDALDIEDARHITSNLGWYGRVRPVSFRALVERVRAFAGGIDGQVRSRKDVIGSVAVCAGLGGLVAGEAVATGADVFVTGELIQPPSSLGCSAVIETGHTRSERVGVTTIRRILGPGVDVDAAPLGVDRFAGEVFRGTRLAA